MKELRFSARVGFKALERVPQKAHFGTLLVLDLFVDFLQNTDLKIIKLSLWKYRKPKVGA